MLNDHERQTLAELENQLTAENPEFVTSFRGSEQRLSRRSRSWPYTAVIAFSILLAVLSIALLLPVAALLATALAVGSWWARQARDPQQRKSTARGRTPAG